MANVFVPSANDPAVFTTDKFPLLKDGDGNTYRTVVKANVNGSVDVYSKGTGSFGGDELLFQYSATRNAANFSVGKFKDKPTTAYNSFFRSSESNGEQFLKDVKTKWYSEAPPNASARMANLPGYKSIAATVQRRTTGTSPSGPVIIQTPAGPVTLDPPQTQSNTDGVDATLTKDIFNLTIEPNEVRSLFGHYKYPTDLGTNGQDFIQFTIKKYKARNFNLGGAIGVLEERQELTPIGTISLPIQPLISDSNNVDWNSGRLNPLEMELVNGSLNIMSQQGQDYVTKLIKRLETTIQDPNTLKAIKLYFAQKAAGTQGLLSRLGGGIVNPNLELLFQGPTLRPFTFTFRLSPREENEAKQVRSIIRAFKEAMSVKTESQSFFLAAPNVFDIKYVMGGKIDHPSLNKIKTCALKSCNVDYTPDGSYMTFNDTNATMTSYNLTLQFQELEPVTNQDYKDIPIDQIGY